MRDWKFVFFGFSASRETTSPLGVDLYYASIDNGTFQVTMALLCPPVNTLRAGRSP